MDKSLAIDISVIEQYESGIDKLPSNYERLHNIFHFAPINSAFEILRTQRINVCVYQLESLLRECKLPICWLTPNEWRNGSFYGCIIFSFIFETLISNKKCYFIEIENTYKYPAYRLLFTSKNRKKRFEKYDLELGRGPLVKSKKTGRFYWNNTCNLQLVFDAPLDLLQIVNIEFTNHKIYKSPKDELETSIFEAYSRFIAFALIESTKSIYPLFVQKNREQCLVSSDMLRAGISNLYDKSKLDYTNGILSETDEESLSVAEESLYFYSHGHWVEWERLAKSFKSRSAYIRTVWKIAKQKVGLI